MVGKDSFNPQTKRGQIKVIMTATNLTFSYLTDFFSIIRDPKVKRRQTIASLLRETRPLKLQKGIVDAQKFPPSIRWLLGQQDPGENTSGSIGAARAAALALSAAVLGRGVEAEVAAAASLRACQLLRLGKMAEASAMMETMDEAVNAKGAGAHPLRTTLQLRWFTAKMAEKADKNMQVSPEEQSKCRQYLVDMRSINPDNIAGAAEVIETSLITLVNLEDWDFLMTLPPDARFPLLGLTQLVLSLLVVLKGGSITLDIKKACQTLADTVRPILGASFGVAGGKRSHNGSTKDEGRAALLRFLASIEHPSFMQVSPVRQLVQK